MTEIIHNPSSFAIMTFILLLGWCGSFWGVFSGENLEVNAPRRPSETRVIDAPGVTSGVTFGGGRG